MQSLSHQSLMDVSPTTKKVLGLEMAKYVKRRLGHRLEGPRARAAAPPRRSAAVGEAMTWRELMLRFVEANPGLVLRLAEAEVGRKQ